MTLLAQALVSSRPAKHVPEFSNLVAGRLEVPGSVVDRAAKARADGQQPADEAGHQVLAGSRGDDRVVRACSKHSFWPRTTCSPRPVLQTQWAIHKGVAGASKLALVLSTC